MRYFLLSFFAFSSLLKAQSAFNMVSVNYETNKDFFIFAEGQLRSIEEYSVPDYYEIKGGVGYNLSRVHKPFIGVGRYVSYKDNRLNKEELRFWLQHTIGLKFRTAKLDNRFRAERGWFSSPNGEKSARYRFRYRLNVGVPLNSKKVEKGTLSANAFSEVFFTISDNDPVFSRNRLFGGLNYQINENIGILSGYLWQKDFGLTKNKDSHFVYLGLNFNFSSAKENK